MPCILSVVHSMLTFLAALMIVFFWHTSLITRAVLGSVLAILFFVTIVLLLLDWNSHSEAPEGSLLYGFCPPGLRSVMLNAKEKWQARGIFRLKRRTRSSNVSFTSETSTAVQSPS